MPDNSSGYYRNATSPAPGVLTPAEWEEARQKQRIDRLLPSSEGSLLGGIQVRPKNVTFVTQNKGEKVFILVRRHWLTNAGWAFNTLIYMLLPGLVYLGFGLLNIDLGQVIGFRIGMLSLLLYYSLIYTSILRHFVDWYFNLYIVTNERVIDYDFKTFISKGASEADLTSIEDVKEASIGVLPSFFNYGDVSIFTAADKNVITFHAIPDPTYVRDKIDDLSNIVKGPGGEN